MLRFQNLAPYSYTVLTVQTPMPHWYPGFAWLASSRGRQRSVMAGTILKANNIFFLLQILQGETRCVSSLAHGHDSCKMVIWSTEHTVHLSKHGGVKIFFLSKPWCKNCSSGISVLGNNVPSFETPGFVPRVDRILINLDGSTLKHGSLVKWMKNWQGKAIRSGSTNSEKVHVVLIQGDVLMSSALLTMCCSK